MTPTASMTGSTQSICAHGTAVFAAGMTGRKTDPERPALSTALRDRDTGFERGPAIPPNTNANNRRSSRRTPAATPNMGLVKTVIEDYIRPARPSRAGTPHRRIRATAHLRTPGRRQ